MSGVALRPARQTDAEEMCRVQDAAVLHAWPEVYEAEEVRAWTIAARGLDATHFRARMAVATELVAAAPGGGLAGFGEIDLESGELTLLFVDPRWTGHGVGARLLLALEDEAARAGVTELSLFASLNAVGFYERYGWRRGARSHNRIGELTIACWCMLRELG